MGAGNGLFEGLSVTDVVVTVVKPFRKIARPETIDATTNDLWAGDLYMPTGFAYRIENQPDGSAYLELVNRMKDSLRKVLNLYYPFAGRWVATSQVSTGRQLLCNDAGVPFIEAYADEDLDHFLPAGSFGPKLGNFNPARLSALHAKSYDVVGLDATQYKQKFLGKELPGLIIQVTRFKCGGVVMSPTFHHMLTDGLGFFTFMKVWSDIALTGQTTITPDFDRASADWSVATKLQNLNPRHLKAANEFGVNSKADAPRFGDESLTPFSKMAFQVKKSVIESMKHDMKVESSGTEYVSTHDCILAHVWRALLRLPPSMTMTGGDEHEQLEMISAVDGRARCFHPPLSPHLCANVVLPMAFPKASAAELLEMPASSVALKIRRILMASSSQQDWTVCRLMETRDIYMRGKIVWHDSSWANFPMYEIDFGHGKPFLAFPPSSTGHMRIALGRSIICPPMPNDHKSAATLHFDTTPEMMEALLLDSEFMSLLSEN